MDLLLDTRNEDVDDVLANLGEHALVVAVELVVLRRDDDGIDALGNACIAILDGDLTLGVRTQIGHHLTLLADLCEGAHDEMREVERHGHEILGLVGGIAEHHTLVASALLVLVAIIDTAVDVLALLMDSSEDTAGVAVELVFGLGIAYLLNRVTCNGLQVDIHITAYLAHQHHLSCSDKRLTSHTGAVVVSQELVENGVANLIGHFIGMAF